MYFIPYSFTFLGILAAFGYLPSSSTADNVHQHPSLTNWEQIHSVLTLYARAIDSKDFGLLSSVFASNAVANFTGPLSNLNGLPAIQAGLEASVAKIDSQHLLGTISIDIVEHGNVVLANSTTYFQASLFGKGQLEGKVLYDYGYYTDEFVLLGYDGWRINKRQLTFQGPGMIGDEAVIGQ